MNLVLYLFSLLDIVTLTVGMAIGMAIIRRSRIFIFRILAMAIGLFSLKRLISILDSNHFFRESPEYLFLPISVSILTPIIYLVLKKLNNDLNWRSDRLHLLPTVAEAGVFMVIFFFPAAIKESLWNSMTFLAGFGFITITINLLYAKKSFNVAEDIRKKGRIRQEIIHKFIDKLTLAAGFLVVVSLVDMLGHGVAIQFNSLSGKDFASLINLIFIFWISIETLLMLSTPYFIPVKDGEQQLAVSKSGANQNPVPATTTEPVESEVDELRDFRRLEHFMLTEKPFLDPEMTIRTLAARLNMSQRSLSQLINNSTGYNYNRFINAYRVAEAMEILNEPNMDHLSITAVGFEAGFNSKASFYAVFKDMAGCSPAEVRNAKKADNQKKIK